MKHRRSLETIPQVEHHQNVARAMHGANLERHIRRLLQAGAGNRDESLQLSRTSSIPLDAFAEPFMSFS